MGRAKGNRGQPTSQGMADKKQPPTGGAKTASRDGCHPGIPRGEELEAQNAAFVASPPAAPAARCIRHGPPPVGPTNDSGVAGMPPPLLGNIVERPPPAAGAVRPPNFGGGRGAAPTGAPLSPAQSAARTASLSPRELEEIGRENEAYLASLSPEEILVEQERLRQMLPPKLYQRWSAKKP